MNGARGSVRVLAAWALAASVGYFLAVPVVQLSLPALRAACDLLQKDFMVQLRIDVVASDPVIRVVCATLQPIYLGAGRWLAASTVFDGGTINVVHVIVPATILWMGLGAWPVSGMRELWLRCAAGVAALPLLLLPSALLIVGRTEAFLAQASATPPSGSARALIRLMEFMELGGRWLLPLLIAGAVLGASRRIAGPSASVAEIRLSPAAVR